MCRFRVLRVFLNFIFYFYYFSFTRPAVSASCSEPCCPAHIVSCLAICRLAPLEQIKMMMMMMMIKAPTANIKKMNLRC